MTCADTLPYPLIYLDNAATTYPKPAAVIRAVAHAMTVYGANPGRGGHRLSMAAAEQVFACREEAAALFGLSNPTRVVFTAGCTMSLNMALHSVTHGVSDARVLTSDMEHNAVTRPLYALPVSHDIAAVAPGDDDGTVRAFRRAITPQTRAILCTHASNVFGTVLPLARLGALAREHGLIFIVDAAQSAGLLPIDMTAMHIDYLCVPGHKGLYGPMGTGLLLCGERARPIPLLRGGTGSNSLSPLQPGELPERLESGTLNTPGLCGLLEGLRFVRAKTPAAILAHEQRLMTLLRARLTDVSGLTLYDGGGNALPLLSLNIAGLHSEQTADKLDAQGIAVRAGLHCAPAAHRKLGTLETGVVRLAPSAFTTEAEILQTARALRSC